MMAKYQTKQSIRNGKRMHVNLCYYDARIQTNGLKLTPLKLTITIAKIWTKIKLNKYCKIWNKNRTKQNLKQMQNWNQELN